MTTFEDGPAQGQILTLVRAPVFLRVVEQDGKFDALDLLEDEPKPAEKIYAYQIVGTPGFAFVDGRNAKGRRTGGKLTIATYRIVPEQPTDAQMRSTTAWQTWCHIRNDEQWERTQA